MNQRFISFLTGLAAVMIAIGALSAQNHPESVPPSNEKIINAFGECKKVQNNHPSGEPIMVPTGTEAGWRSFLNNLPAGVSVTACDLTPDEFDFVDVDKADIHTIVESNTVTINDINTAVGVTVSGDGNPEANIADKGWTSSPGNIEQGESLQPNGRLRRYPQIK